jgi:hypothetical protein
MQLTGTDGDPWKHILHLLQQDCSSSSGHERRARQPFGEGRSGRTVSSYFPTCVAIGVLDYTDRTATLTWHDPTACHYDDQRWHRAAAQCNGVCAMTGALITRGADVFRPSRRKTSRAPRNAGAMILASALLALPLIDPAI